MSVTLTGQPVVVGIDGTDDGARAALFGADEALARGCALRLAYAYHTSTALNPMLPVYGIDNLRECGERAVSAARAQVVEHAPNLRVTSAVVQGSPNAVLVEASAKACLVVVGRRALNGLERVFTGSTSTAVAARSKCPVVVVPAEWRPGEAQQLVVVGVDGSPRSQAAVALAFESAARLGASLFAVQVWEMPNWWATDGHDRTEGIAAWTQRAELMLAEDLAGWKEEYPDVHVVKVFERSHPAEALVRRSNGAALLVMGARGLGGVPGLQLGSTARSVLAHASCPVLIVRSRKEAVRRRKPRSVRTVPAVRDLPVPTY
jgi:nucleotide-binding universal stress UspA family protein